MTDKTTRRVADALRRNDELTALPASRYSFAELAELYNEGRVDYIVPMPMNARRMEEYVRHYDVDLDASAVVLNDADEHVGIGMVGLRGGRAWITRLGVIPARRGRRAGQFIVETLLEAARRRGAAAAQLEVILGNAPAHSLFIKLGFCETRELLVLRRPPAAPSQDQLALLRGAEVVVLNDDEIAACLGKREMPVSWIEETASMMKIGGLAGLRVTLPPHNGTGARTGCIVFAKSAFQMSHFVLVGSAEMALPLLLAVHQQFPRHDTKLENLPADSPYWAAFQTAGYLETFRRIEMVKRF